MSQDLLITLVSYLLSCATGLGIAFLGFQKKYPTELKYAFRLLPTWIYMLLTAVSSLLFVAILEAIGMRVVGDSRINAIIIGIIGPAVFLGVVSRLPPVLPSNNEIDQQLKTLGEYVFNILDISIQRKTTQIVELKIRDAGKDSDPDIFLREVDNMLDGVTKLSNAQKRTLRVRFDKAAMSGQYASIIRELKQYYDVDYIIQRLSPEDERNRMRNRLYNLMRLALETHGPPNSVLPEWVFAKVQALQKNPDDTLHHLEKALQKKPSLKNQILTDDIDWWILTSMTHGEKQQAKLESLLRLMGIEHLSLEDVKQQCMHQDKLSITFMAVKRSNGDCVRITLRRGIQDHQADSIRWWIRVEGEKRLDKECADLNEVMSHIEKAVIPLRLM